MEFLETCAYPKGGDCDALLLLARKALVKRSRWSPPHAEPQRASLRRSSYDEPRCAADTVGCSAVHLLVVFDIKLEPLIGQEHGVAADTQLAPRADR